MKRIVLISLLLALSVPLGATRPGKWYDHLDYGVEWGYTASFFEAYHYNYTSPSSGARIDTRDSHLSYKSNGHIYGFVGAKFARRFALDAAAGWAGLFESRRMVPLTLRGSYFFRGYDRDGWKLFAEGGCCLGESHTGKAVGIARLGSGYRVMLDRNFALDLSLSLQGVSDHPTNVYDKAREEAIPDASLRRSDCNYFALSFSVALSF